MTAPDKKALINSVERDYGIQRLFEELGLKDVRSNSGGISCVCPFHDGADNPNGFYYAGGFGYCFTGCHRSFDLFDIVCKAKAISFAGAVGFLSSLVGFEASSQDRHEPVCKSSRNFLETMRRIKRKRTVKTVQPIDPAILSGFIPKLYSGLRAEGFDDEVRDYFSLGYADTGPLGGRITIPIDDISGNIISVSGRSISSCDCNRYKIWHGTEKSETLYNIGRALPYIKEKREVIVVEGFKSVWRLHQWDIRNAVATMRSSLSERQKLLLASLNCLVIACGDRDEAGALLNRQISIALARLSDVRVMDMFTLDVSEKSSIDDITKEQFLHIYNNKILDSSSILRA